MFEFVQLPRDRRVIRGGSFRQYRRITPPPRPFVPRQQRHETTTEMMAQYQIIQLSLPFNFVDDMEPVTGRDREIDNLS